MDNYMDGPYFYKSKKSAKIADNYYPYENRESPDCVEVNKTVYYEDCSVDEPHNNYYTSELDAPAGAAAGCFMEPEVGCGEPMYQQSAYCDPYAQAQTESQRLFHDDPCRRVGCLEAMRKVCSTSSLGTIQSLAGCTKSNSSLIEMNEGSWSLCKSALLFCVGVFITKALFKVSIELNG